MLTYFKTLMTYFKMRELPLTTEQVEICNTTLKGNIKTISTSYFQSKGYDVSDIKVAVSFMIDSKLIISFAPFVNNDLGSKYSKTGIAKFILDQRRDRFLNSPGFKTVAIWIPIFISLVFNVTNCSRTDNIKNEDILSKKQYRDIDSTVKEFGKKLDKITVMEFATDTSKIFDNGINEKPK